MRTTKKERRTLGRLAAALVLAVAGGLVIVYLRGRHYQVLDAAGSIAGQQRNLLIFATLLSLVIILPVFYLTWHIVRTYRIDSKRPARTRPYDPEWSHSRKLETAWWLIPSLIILVLSVVTWQSSHALDPYRPISSPGGKAPLTVQVVAMQWDWLFLYPEQGVASINRLVVPTDTPLAFQLTADAPMNSFWIPQLGGQIYAMSGMTSRLHLTADKPGIYRGVSANLSGAGHAEMDFEVVAQPAAEFDGWIQRNQAAAPLDAGRYAELRGPQTDRGSPTYTIDTGSGNGLFQIVLQTYGGSHHDGDSKPAGNDGHQSGEHQ